jgi:hypothetical protein
VYEYEGKRARAAAREGIGPTAALIAGALLSGALLYAALLGPTADARPAGAERAKAPTPTHTFEQSRELWATVDVCNPSDQHDTVGIRGSMPSDGHPLDTMYMRFQLQYRSPGGSWTDLSHDGVSGFIAVGSAKVVRQGGTSFQLMSAGHTSAYALRGLVTFQWRHGKSVEHQLTRTTSAGHHGVGDADPPGYSAAQCTIG